MTTLPSRLAGTACLCLCLALCLPTALPADITWTLETVASAGTVGLDTNLAIDSAGTPHISYVANPSAGDDTLRYSTRSGGLWSTETLTDHLYGQNYVNSLALDSSGTPHVAYYYSATDQDLHYQSRIGGTWSDAVVTSEGQVGSAPSLVFDSDDHPHISYVDATGGLRYAEWTGSSWNIQSIGLTQAYYTSLVLDSSGQPHIAYQIRNGTERYLGYAYLAGATWVSGRVDSHNGSGFYAKLVLDAGGNPGFAYYDSSANALRYARFQGTTVIIQTVATGSNVGLYCDLALNGQGNPAISYRDGLSGNLRYAYWDGARWTSLLVDPGTNTAYWTSLAFDPTGNPHISYFDFLAGDLRLASGLDSSSVPEPATLLLGLLLGPLAWWGGRRGRR